MITPLYERLIVKRKAIEQKTASGIYMPEDSQEKPLEGEVVAAGKGMRGEDGNFIPMEVQVGNSVMFGRYTGTEIEVDGEEYLIMSEQEVLGVL